MGFFAKAFFRGLAAVVPVLLTVYVLWWFLSGTEELLRDLVPKKNYKPGLGIAAGIVVTFVSGLLLSNWIVRWIHDLGISLFERVPLVKPIYRMLKDMLSFFAHSDRKEFNQVVMVRPVKGGPEMLGFVTRPTWEGMPDGFGGDGKIGVYLPMSYQIGGFLIVVDKQDVRPIEMDMEVALRIALAAGITAGAEEQQTAPA